MTRPVPLRDTKFDMVKAQIAFALTGGDPHEARQKALRIWGPAGTPTEITKAADGLMVSDIDSSSSNGLMDRALFGAAREQSFLFRMRGTRPAGFYTRSVAVSNATAAFVGEGKPILVAKPTILNVGLTPAKVAGMTVVTVESLEATPGIERVIFSDLARAFAEAVDFALLDPTNDGSGLAPASITYGAPAIAATGSFDDDLAEVFAAFSGDLSQAVFLTTPQIAAGLADGFAGRDLGARGGELSGVPVMVSRAAPAGQLTLTDPSTILVAHDEELELQTSEHGTVEMVSSEPTQDPPTGSALVSLWQNNLKSLRCIGRVAWAAAGPSTSVSITGLFPAAS